MIHWLVSLAALVGVILNIHRHPSCFGIWAVTNASWCVIDWTHELYAQSALQAIYFLLSIWGLWKWSQKGGADGEKNSR